MTRAEAIAEELRRMGDRSRPGHDNPHTIRVRIRTVQRLRGLPDHPEFLSHADLYRLGHAA